MHADDTPVADVAVADAVAVDVDVVAVDVVVVVDVAVAVDVIDTTVAVAVAVDVDVDSIMVGVAAAGCAGDQSGRGGGVADQCDAREGEAAQKKGFLETVPDMSITHCTNNGAEEGRLPFSCS